MMDLLLRRRMMGNDLVLYDWLKTDGLAYINTHHKLITIRDKVVMEAGGPNNQDNMVLGGVRWDGTFNGNAQVYFNQNENKIVPIALNPAVPGSISKFNYKEISTYIADFYNGIYTLDGVTYNHGVSESTGVAVGYSWYLFGLNNKGSALARYANMIVRRCEIYRDDVLIHNFHPCEYNGVYGMWDMVDNQFYPPLGGGNFTAGND